jgi:ABC-type multidrug transport system fused ATPase/permease subunit
MNRSAPERIRTLYRVFGPYLKPYRWQIATAYFALGCSVLMTLLRPWPLKLILDSVILEKSSIHEAVPVLPSFVDSWEKHLLLTLLCISLVVIVLIESLFGYAQKVRFSSVGHSATTDVLEHAFTHLQMLPRTAGNTRTGDVIVRLTTDVKTLRDLLVNHVQKLGSYGLTFVSTLAVMFWMNWQLTLLGLLVVPFIYATSYYFSRNIRVVTKQKRKKEGAVASIVQETLTSMAVVQAFAQEKQEQERFRDQARASLDASIESARLGGAFTRSIKVLSTIGAAMVIWLGASRVIDGQMSPGDLVVFAAYITELYLPIQNISELAVQFMESLVSGERVLDLLETAPRIKDSAHAVKAPEFSGEVVFENVDFGYSPNSPVLQGLNLHIEPGRTVALIGGSGAGKSTILNLLLRFYDPWHGRVTVDGQDIRRFKLHSLRSQISVVLQESFLFRRTVRENIAYGKPRASLDQIVEAAKAAHAHDFIEELPDGYDTVLDESGGNLSGGQRQRIALARAFLRNAPILVLDEPTSGLDAVTEASLTETLDELAHGKTTIIIAHRFSTIEKADMIFVLEQGRVVQCGRHGELLSQGGLYRELFEAQQTESEPA